MGNDPGRSDKNNDGQITLDELVERFSSGRISSSAPIATGSSSTGSSTSASSSSGSSSSGSSSSGSSSAAAGESRERPSRGFGGGRRSGFGRGGDSAPPRAAVNASGKAYRFLSPSERLPEGLPVSFTSKDRDGDGQLSMSEFASVWTAGTVAEFSRWDVNGDGFATAAECLAAEKSGGGR